jgi:hypothetical protein
MSSTPPAPHDEPTVGMQPPVVPESGDLPPVPGFEVLRELGRGGMGVVYLAREVALNRVVALKMILAGQHASTEERQRFRREAEAIARVHHPHIVAVHAIGEQEGRPFFSLEYCEGGSLSQRLAARPLTPVEAAELVEKLARAMHKAHEHGVIHRDLKPGNVLLTPDGTPKITDFGLAKKLDEAGVTQTGTVMGTPAYMAPEQASGMRVLTPAVDIYSLGAILYECLTGRPPFQADSTMNVVLQVLHDEPVAPRRLRPDVPRDLEAICLKCLEKPVGRRYATAEALAEDLRRYRAGEPISVVQQGLLGQMAGLMEQVQLQEKFAAYGSLLFWLAPVMLLTEVWVTLALQLHWPTILLAMGQYVRIGLFLLLVGIFREGRWLPQNPNERQLWAVWCGYIFCCLGAGITVRLQLGFLTIEPEAKIYPLFALLAAMAFFSLAGNFWAYCVHIGLVWIFAAWAMALWNDAGPLIYGSLWAIILVILGCRLRALGAKGASK